MISSDLGNFVNFETAFNIYEMSYEGRLVYLNLCSENDWYLYYTSYNFPEWQNWPKGDWRVQTPVLGPHCINSFPTLCFDPCDPTCCSLPFLCELVVVDLWWIEVTAHADCYYVSVWHSHNRLVNKFTTNKLSFWLKLWANWRLESKVPGWTCFGEEWKCYVH